MPVPLVTLPRWAWLPRRGAGLARRDALVSLPRHRPPSRRAATPSFPCRATARQAATPSFRCPRHRAPKPDWAPAPPPATPRCSSVLRATARHAGLGCRAMPSRRDELMGCRATAHQSKLGCRAAAPPRQAGPGCHAGLGSGAAARRAGPAWPAATPGSRAVTRTRRRRDAATPLLGYRGPVPPPYRSRGGCGAWSTTRTTAPRCRRSGRTRGRRKH
jgi:hypothetical protein